MGMSWGGDGLGLLVCVWCCKCGMPETSFPRFGLLNRGSWLGYRCASITGDSHFEQLDFTIWERHSHWSIHENKILSRTPS